MPRRRAARKMVSPARMSTSRSSMLKVFAFALPFPLIVIAFAPVVPAERPTGEDPRGARAGTHNHRLSLWVPAFAGTTLEHAAACSSPTPERLRQLLREILQHAQERVRRRLAEPADRGVAHGVRELRQQRLIPGSGCHQRSGLLGSRPAGRALAAALVLEEAHQVE